MNRLPLLIGFFNAIIVYILALKKPISNESHLLVSVAISNNLMLIYSVTKSSDSSFLLSRFNIYYIICMSHMYLP